MTDHERKDEPTVDSPSPHDAPSVWAPRLRRLLEQQESLCDELDALSSQQHELVGADRGDELLTLLNTRQGLVDRMLALHSALDPFRQSWHSFLDRLEKADRIAIEQKVASIESAMQRITKADERDRAALELRRESLSASLSGVSRGRDAIAAYGGRREATGPRYQDRSG